MSILDDIKANAENTFGQAWTVRNGVVVPDPKEIKHSNDAVYFEKATILYADLDSSTDLVAGYKWTFSGEVYKTFLYAASRLIRGRGGAIVSYDGDRVMGIFTSKTQLDDAVSCALEINWAVKNILQSSLRKSYTTDFNLKHVIGIDQSEIRAARTGVRGDNDLVWIGNSANLAAKLTALSAETPTWITKPVYEGLSKGQKNGPQGEDIWKKWLWNEHDNREIYSTHYWKELK